MPDESNAIHTEFVLFSHYYLRFLFANNIYIRGDSFGQHCAKRAWDWSIERHQWKYNTHAVYAVIIKSTFVYLHKGIHVHVREGMSKINCIKTRT